MSIICILYLDMTDPAVEKDVKKAIKDTLGFLQKNLYQSVDFLFLPCLHGVGFSF